MRLFLAVTLAVTCAPMTAAQNPPLAPYVGVGIGAGQIAARCDACGGSSWSDRTLTTTARVGVMLPNSRLGVGVEALLYHASRKQFTVLTASISMMLLGGRVSIGGGVGAALFRDTVTYIVVPAGTLQTESRTSPSGAAEIHLSTALPVFGHVALGPYFMYATSLGGFPSGGRSVDRDILHFGLNVLWRSSRELPN